MITYRHLIKLFNNLPTLNFQEVRFPVACHWIPGAVGGPRAAESHSCAGPLPSILLPLQTRSPTQLSIQPLFSAQKNSHSEKGTLDQLQEEEGGEEGRENALETWLIKK